MTDEQIEQHIVMERGGKYLKMLNQNKDKATKTANTGVLQNCKG